MAQRTVAQASGGTELNHLHVASSIDFRRRIRTLMPLSEGLFAFSDPRVWMQVLWNRPASGVGENEFRRLAHDAK